MLKSVPHANILIFPPPPPPSLCVKLHSVQIMLSCSRNRKNYANIIVLGLIQSVMYKSKATYMYAKAVAWVVTNFSWKFAHCCFGMVSWCGPHYLVHTIYIEVEGLQLTEVMSFYMLNPNECACIQFKAFGEISFIRYLSQLSLVSTKVVIYGCIELSAF
jgi:hypothetical protein